MADERSDDSPSAEFNSAETFSLLGDSTRLAILRSLWEAQKDREKKTVPFEVLRERVGVADSGRFNYHLGKLTNRFITQTNDGYQLRYAGTRVVGALLEGLMRLEMISISQPKVPALSAIVIFEFATRTSEYMLFVPCVTIASQILASHRAFSQIVTRKNSRASLIRIFELCLDERVVEFVRIAPAR